MADLVIRSVAAAVLIGGLMFGVQAAEDEAMTSEQWVERMQQHWQHVIREEDPDKRRQLLREHERIMEQAADSPAMHEDKDAERMNDSEQHRDLQNNMEMHRHMMDMMR